MLRIVYGVGLVGLAALAVLVAFRWGQGARQFRAKGNVIVITVDTLRADYLGSYGHPTIQTPFTNRLAEEGVRFTKAYAQSHITLPSHLSVLTGRYPKDHGVVDNTRTTLPPDIATLADVLRGAGFRTVAVTSNRILRPAHVKGLGRGFETFLAPEDPERPGGETNEHFLSWLREHADERFFAWVHYFDPHLPYEAPVKYADLYYSGNPRDPGFTSMEPVVFPPAWMNPESWANRLIAWMDGIRDFRYPVSQYEAEISYADAMIGELLAELAALRIDGRTLVVLTADHGESLDEHNIYFGHFSLYEPSTHVPLIVWAPRVFDGGRSIDELVMSIDIMPTVLELLGMERSEGVAGRSVVPLLDGRTTEGPHTYVFGQGSNNKQLMVRSEQWKYIRTGKGLFVNAKFRQPRGARELYDLEADPGETVNVYEEKPHVAERLDQVLSSWFDVSPSAEEPTPPVKPDKLLEALGYVE